MGSGGRTDDERDEEPIIAIHTNKNDEKSVNERIDKNYLGGYVFSWKVHYTLFSTVSNVPSTRACRQHGRLNWTGGARTVTQGERISKSTQQAKLEHDGEHDGEHEKQVLRTAS